MKKITVISSMYRCRQYLEGFFDFADKIDNPDEVEILLLHNDPQPEELEIIKRRIAGKSHYHYVEVKQREGLYATWNRGIKMAEGEYIAIWNVDDSRLPDSLSSQARTLDEHPEAAMTYGNYYLGTIPHQIGGKPVNEPEYTENTRGEFRRSHFVGCFPMWRKSIHEKIGYFDEQFRLVADYEFQVRTAFRYPFAKTEKILGNYFQGNGSENRLSQSSSQNVERTVVEIRYGIFDKTLLPFWQESKRKYSISRITSLGEKTEISSILPELEVLRKKNRPQLFFACLKLPRYFAKRLLGR